MSRSPHVVSLALSAVLVACSSSGNGESTPGDTGLDVGGDTEIDALAAGEQACLDGWAINCHQYAKCAPLAFQRLFASEAECAKGYAAGCKENFFNDPNVSWTLERARACVTAVSTYYGDTCQKWIRQFWGRTNTSMKDAVPACWSPGTLAIGAPCTLGQDCQSEYCEVVAGKACGTCKARLATDATCNVAKYNQCVSNSTCVGAKCIAFGDVGASCTSSNGCYTDLACLSGKCAPRLAVGDACDPTLGSAECGVTQVCNTKTLRCEYWTLAKADQPCGRADSGSYALCERGLTCKVTDTFSGTGVCVAKVEIGEACTVDGLECVWPATCANKVCTLLRWNSCG
jgi:hypothetical protein